MKCKEIKYPFAQIHIYKRTNYILFAFSRTGKEQRLIVIMSVFVYSIVYMWMWCIFCYHLFFSPYYTLHICCMLNIFMPITHIICEFTVISFQETNTSHLCWDAYFRHDKIDYVAWFGLALLLLLLPFQYFIYFAEFGWKFEFNGDEIRQTEPHIHVSYPKYHIHAYTAHPRTFQNRNLYKLTANI